MAHNPLMDARKQTGTRDLDAYCVWLNSLSWVRASGQPYFIIDRVGPNGRERILSR